jgi:cytidine deaminase
VTTSAPGGAVDGGAADGGAVNGGAAPSGAVNGGAVDWAELRAAAVAAAAHAHCPYSGLQVGAAALCSDGRVVVGCNVENASYGLALCAECTMAGQLRLSGGGSFVAVACRSGSGELLTPCGRCRQILYELGGPACLIDTPRGPLPLRELLPAAFGPADLPSGPSGPSGPSAM